MPEGEGQEKAAEEKSGGGDGFFSGTKAFIIFIAAETLTILFFMAYIHFKPTGTGKDEEVSKVYIKPEDYNKYQHSIKDLSYSVQTQVGRSAILSISLTITLGKTDEEMQNPNFSITSEQWKVFKDALERMEPDIKDILQQHISQQTFTQLNSASGQELIRRRVKEFVNSEFEKLKIPDFESNNISKKRVTKVRITRFFMQQ